MNQRATLRVVPILKFILRLTIVLLVQNYLHVFHQNQKNSQWKSLESIQSTICLTEVQLLRSTRRRKKGLNQVSFLFIMVSCPMPLKWVAAICPTPTQWTLTTFHLSQWLQWGRRLSSWWRHDYVIWLWRHLCARYHSWYVTWPVH